jgi:hypothetical protein
MDLLDLLRRFVAGNPDSLIEHLGLLSPPLCSYGDAWIVGDVALEEHGGEALAKVTTETRKESW